MIFQTIYDLRGWRYLLSGDPLTSFHLLYSILPALLGFLVLYYLIPYLKLWRLRDIPGPRVAAFTNTWLLLQARRRNRAIVVDNAHKKYGKIIRLAPKQISIADSSAIQAIYGHGNGFLKAEFYDAFLNVYRSIFTSRDRAEHSRKRKTISHAFSAKSIADVEQYAHSNINLFVKQWRKISQTRRDPETGYATIDALTWFSYLSFDIIGDLAFGSPFGMLEKDKDIVEMQMSPDEAPTYVNAIEVLHRRGEVAATLGVLPALIPYSRWLPDHFFRDGAEAISNLAGIAVSAVNRRLKMEDTEEKRLDLLTRLIEGKDQTGVRLGRREITGEALTLITAGSDTTSNTFCALLYWVLKTPGVISKLQKALDDAIPADVEIPPLTMVRGIQYLQWVIWEALRIHSTFATGLPREVPPGAPVEICGHSFYPGDILSVPIYTIHHLHEIWGSDADCFVPERWEPSRITAKQKEAFIPFSVGPRACVGRNLAEMELFVGCATFFRLFDIQLQQDEPMEVKEGFLRKPVGLKVGIKPRILPIRVR